MMQYMQDYDNRVPPRYSMTPTGRKISWRAALSPYTKTVELFRCPTDQARDMVDFENDGFPRSYAVDSSPGGPFDDRNPSLRMDKVAHPESVIAVLESTAAFDDFNPLLPGMFARPTREGRLAGHLFAGHNGGTNILFFDGHVKPMRPLDLLPVNGTNPWTTDGSPYSATDYATAKSTLAYGLSQSKVDGQQ